MFARTVAEAQEYATAFSAAGIATACVHAGTPEDERAHALAQFRSGRVRLLSNVYVMTEGVDLPAASVCILARSIGSVGGYLQMVGRILRPALGKTSATLIDLPGISHDHGCPEDERMFSLEGKAISLVVRACKVCSAPLSAGYPCPRCGYEPELAGEEGVIVNATITGDPLVKFARKIAESPEQRWENLQALGRCGTGKRAQSGQRLAQVAARLPRGFASRVVPGGRRWEGDFDLDLARRGRAWQAGVAGRAGHGSFKGRHYQWANIRSRSQVFRPLIMHDGRLSDPLDEKSKRLKLVTSKKKKSDEDLAEIKRIEFEGAMYFDEKLGPYLPCANLQACMCAGARKRKLGQSFEAMVEVMIPPDGPQGYALEYWSLGPTGTREPGPRTLKALFAKTAHVLRERAKVGMSAVMRTRPRFSKWSCTFLVEVLDDDVDDSQVKQAFEDAGKYCGIGDWTPRYGRFEVSSFDAIRNV